MAKGKVVRKLYLYSDISSYQHRLKSGEYETRRVSIADALRFIEALPRDEAKDPNGFFSVEGGESNVSLRIAIDEGDYIAGLFGKRRIYGLPTMENSSGLIYRVGTKGDRDGIYEGAHFVYFIKERKLFLERSQYTPRKTTLQLFISNKLYQHPTVHIDNVFFRSVVRNDVDKILTRYGDITGFEIDVDQDYLDDIERYDGKLGSMLRTLKELVPEGQQIRFGRSTKRYQRVGGMSEAKPFILGLLDNAPEAISRAIATVKFEDERRGPAVPINLITEETGYPVTIPTDENRVVDSNAVWSLMLNLFERIQSGEEVGEEADEQSQDESI